MRRLHLAVGLLAVLVFLITGQLMRHHTPPLDTLDAATRLLFRSRHIYILASGLVNAMLGLYLGPRTGWRRSLQVVGSAFLIAAPAFLVLAYSFETVRPFGEETPWSHAGLYALFGGGMSHVIASIGKAAA